MEKLPELPHDEQSWPQEYFEELVDLKADHPVFYEAVEVQRHFAETTYKNPFEATASARQVLEKLDDGAKELINRPASLYGPDIFVPSLSISDDPDSPGIERTTARLPNSALFGTTQAGETGFYGFTHYLKKIEQDEQVLWQPQICYALRCGSGHSLAVEDPSHYGGDLIVFGNIETSQISFYEDEAYQSKKDGLNELFDNLPAEKYEDLVGYNQLLAEIDQWTPDELTEIDKTARQILSGLDGDKRRLVEENLSQLASSWLDIKHTRVKLKASPSLVNRDGTKTVYKTGKYEGLVTAVEFVDGKVPTDESDQPDPEDRMLSFVYTKPGDPNLVGYLAWQHVTAAKKV